ncbi:hypothetical protein [Nostoc sp.]|uniref:hypothetical protein n=1 Tax=Nostoc sp. TaxID=1180 RepID=UPI002FF8E356
MDRHRFTIKLARQQTIYGYGSVGDAYGGKLRSFRCKYILFNHVQRTKLQITFG